MTDNQRDLNEKVRQWWNNNPYTYGLASREGFQDVGNVDDTQVDGHFFDEYMRKTRKRFHDAQRDDQPLAARFIDYDRLHAKTALDIATGLGWAAIEMARAGAHVTAIDLTDRSIEMTRQHFAYRNLNVDLRVMDAQHMAFPDATFDFVHAWGCLMHMPDTEGAIRELYRVTKPGGWSSGYMYNKRSVSYWWHIWFLRGVLMGKLITYNGDTTKLVSRYTDGNMLGGNMLTKVYSPEEAVRMFETAGFVDVRVDPWGPPEMLDGFPFSKLRLGKLLPYPAKKAIADRYGWGMIYTARKPE